MIAKSRPRSLESFGGTSESTITDNNSRNRPSFIKDNMNGDDRRVDDNMPLLPDMISEVKYKKAYYYELDNDTFNAALQTTFQPSVMSYLSDYAWSAGNINDVPIQKAYASVIDRITNTLRSPQALSLPDGSFSRLQITHDRLLDAMIGIPKNSNDSTLTMLKCELTLYRESKYQGKNIGCVCTVDDQNNVYFVQMKVIGVVSADNIQGLSLPGIGTDLAYSS